MDSAWSDRSAGHAEAVWAEVSPLLEGFTVEVLPSIDSTNSELMRRARDGQTAPCLLMAHTQTAGRGRRGRTWVDAPGDSLTFSLGLALAPADWSGLSLAVGLGLAQALHPRVRLKWPNDLWLDGNKLGGILVETASLPGAPSQRRWVGVGVGINLRAPEALPPTGPEAPAGVPPTGLRRVWPEATPGAVLQAVARPLVQALLRFEHSGFAPLVRDYNERDALAGVPVWVSDGHSGVARGVDASGALQLQTAQGTVALTHHEVSVRPC